jgi:hypothetical protein
MEIDLGPAYSEYDRLAEADSIVKGIKSLVNGRGQIKLKSIQGVIERGVDVEIHEQL